MRRLLEHADRRAQLFMLRGQCHDRDQADPRQKPR